MKINILQEAKMIINYFDSITNIEIRPWNTTEGIYITGMRGKKPNVIIKAFPKNLQKSFINMLKIA